ncbi:MAG: hypothetical protein K0S60_300 [Evtepia sp.]|nr:hypothetical protein [Evtepia sp.]
MDWLFRSLHMKLVLIMILLVTSLMTVAGAFLINSVGQFYLKDFYSQMEEIFSDYQFLNDLRTPKSEDENPVEELQIVLKAKLGALGINSRNRSYFILDGKGAVLEGSNDKLEESLEKTKNIFTATEGKPGFQNDLTANYMDVAVPITRGDTPYIIYILDNRQAAQDLSGEMFVLIIEALGFGLVISILLSFLLSKTMIIPIQRLTESAKRMAGGDFSETITVESQDEIGVLTNTFNDMAGQLKKTIQEVENERTKLDALFLHMTDGVVAFNRIGTVIHSNPAAEEMLSRRIPTEGDVDYNQLFGSITPLSEVLVAHQDCLEEDMTLGERRLHLLFASFSREEQAGVLVVIHDVTQQVKTEEMRREFVANVSHELRTPLTNIRSYAETLADTSDLPQEMQHNFLQVILNESDRMAHIVQDLLTLSRFDSSRGDMNFTYFSFETALQDLYQAVRLEAQRHGHELKLKTEHHLPKIRADRERILQVMMNIVSNSIKYTPDGGYIIISSGVMENGVWVEVSDNGIGIPSDDQERIFERFYRVDKARSRESGGTGLGLSIAKEIVDRHEGILSLVNREGPGTTVRLELKAEGPEHG